MRNMKANYYLQLPNGVKTDVMTYNQARHELSECKKNWEWQIEELRVDGVLPNTEEVGFLFSLYWETKIVKVVD